MNDPTERLQALRRLAEEQVRDLGPLPQPDDPLALEALLYELRVHQAQLEMQNDELRRTQEELQQHKRRYEELYDLAPVGYLCLDANAMILTANMTMAAMLEVERASLLQRPFASLLAATAQDSFYRQFRRHFSYKDFSNWETVLQRPDGSTFHARLDAVPRQDEGADRCFLTVTDISSQVEAADRLRRARDEWEQTFDTIPDIITIQDIRHQVLRANPAALDYLGLTPETARGRHCHELFHNSPHPCPDCLAEGLLRDGRPRIFEIVHPESGRILNVSLAPLRDQDGLIRGYVHAARDITGQKQLEEHAQQSRKMEAIGTLAGGIAHDFNNILGVILGYAELILYAGTTLQSCREQAKKIHLAGQRAKELVQQILTFSRREALHAGPLLLAPLVRETVTMLRSMLPRSVDIKLVIDNEDACAAILPHSLQQILLNLASNAEHALRGIPEARLVLRLATVSLSAAEALPLGLAEGPHVRLDVGDNGTGMSPQVQKRIFEPFFTTKEVGEGTGMGLAIIHGLIRDHGGAVTVDSTPGAGTLFHVLLPHLPSNGEAQDKNDVAAPSLATTEQHAGEVLLVDDEPALMQAVRQMIEFLGYRVTATCSPAEALHLFEAAPSRFLAIITDQSMPGMPGSELARHILAARPEQPVILATGFSSTINREQALAMGIRAYLEKPYTIKTLRETLQGVTSHDASSG